MAMRRAIALNREQLTFGVALWFVAFGNIQFWSALWRAAGGWHTGNGFFLATLPVFLLAWIYLTLSLLSWGRATKPVLALLVIAAAFAEYFIWTYGVLIDHAMIANVMETHAAEAQELLNARLALWVLLFGALPALLVWRARVRALPWSRQLKLKALGMAGAALTLVVVVLANYSHYASVLRNHRELRLVLVPSNLVSAVHGYVERRVGAPHTLQAIGQDATRAAAHGVKPLLLILVIGETARAGNFSLNGYARPTNAELARENVLSFSDVRACGTSTAVSLPCMFLLAGREHFTPTLASRQEGLLDVLQRAGIAVRWHDNNSGCKGICDRVPHEDLSRGSVAGLCRDGECYDDILLHGLQADLDRQAGDAVIVLHMKGSHGPAYFRRYPEEYRVFTPACERVELDRCSRDEIVNAYDNTLRYTDHVLSETIRLLRRNAQRFDTAMIYVSDHGESLGENGIYLHGFPYALAPHEQLQVPMIVWLSEGLARDRSIDLACLKARRDAPLSHDYIFHSVLGLADVRTSIYRGDRDLFAPCRPRPDRIVHAGLTE